LSKSIDQAATSAEYRSAIENLGQELAYLNAADFAKFWAADAKHADEAVHLIGRVQG
jgi:tripartite-type tricarboxylate transporter receptor subunit TctC